MREAGNENQITTTMRKGSGNLAAAIGLYKSGVDLTKLRTVRNLVEQMAE